MRVAFLIRALTMGGAERQLVQLASELSRREHEVVVVTFYEGLPAQESILRDAGVGLQTLRKQGRWDFGFIRRLRRTMVELAPDVMYSFLPSSNVLAALVKPSTSKAALVWGVRASNVKKHSYDWLGRLVNIVERRFQALPDLVIVNSRSGIEVCRANGFSADLLRYIPNGIDESRFRFNQQSRDQLRLEWGVDGLVVGFAGRLDPMKGVETLIRALSQRTGLVREAFLIIAGKGKARYSERLRQEVESLGMAARVRWVGALSDMSAFYSAVDVLCLPSLYGEGTSNVIAEALACGCPCAATRVGDAEMLVQDASMLAKPGDVAELHNALIAAARESGQRNREVLRDGILKKLPFATMVDETERALREAVARHAEH